MAVKFSEFTEETVASNITGIVGYVSSSNLNVRIAPADLNTSYDLTATDNATNNVPLVLTGSDGSTDTVNLVGTGTVFLSSTGNVITIEGGVGVSTFTNANGTYVSATTVNTNATGDVTTGVIDLSAVDGTSDSTTRFLSKDNTWDLVDRGVTGSGTANIVPLWTDTTVLGDSVIAQSGTNIGINVTDPDAQLEIVNSSGGSYRLGYAGTNVYFDSENFYIRAGDGNSNKLIVNSSGNVGIGTSSPSAPLTVKTNSLGVSIRALGRTADGYSFLTFRNSTDSATLGEIGISNAQNMQFYTAGTERLRIDSSGNVIQSGTSPQYQFVTPNNYNFQIAVQENVSNGLEITPSTAAGGTTFTTPAVVVKSDGNVGIGTTAPSAPLTVKTNSSGVSIRALGRSADGYSFLTFRNSTDSATLGEIGISNAQNMQFYTAGTERMRIDSSGRVGIGTTSPLAKLNIDSATEGDSYLLGGTGNIRQLKFSTFATASPHAGHKIDATSANGIIALATGGTERMRIDSAGQVKFNNYTSASAFPGTAVANLAVDSSGNIITQAAAGLAVVEVGAGATVAAAATTLYVFTASSGSASTLTLPASPAVGDTIKISNIGGLANIVGANTNNIMGVSTDMTIDVATSSFELIWTGISATGWVILSNV